MILLKYKKFMIIGFLKRLIINKINYRIIMQKCYYNNNEINFLIINFIIRKHLKQIHFYTGFLKDFLIITTETKDLNGNRVLRNKYLKMFIRFRDCFLIKTVSDEIYIFHNNIFDNKNNQKITSVFEFEYNNKYYRKRKYLRTWARFWPSS